MLIETDVILASIIPDHQNHTPALTVLQTENLLLSPYTPLELNLLIRAGRIEIKSFQRFSQSLERLLRSHDVEIITDKLAFHAKAQVLEDEYELSFFDSLHAAVGVVSEEELCSFDRTYRKLKGEGLQLVNPRTI